jgi:uncharacterized protein DUF2613
VVVEPAPLAAGHDLVGVGTHQVNHVDCPVGTESTAQLSERPKTRSAAGTPTTVCYFGRMDRFLVPAAASIVVGLLLGAAAIFGVTLMVQQDTKPPLQAGDPASSVLNRVEYGDRT